jgi:hypothetical protein
VAGCEVCEAAGKGWGGRPLKTFTLSVPAPKDPLLLLLNNQIQMRSIKCYSHTCDTCRFLIAKIFTGLTSGRQWLISPFCTLEN